MDIILLSYWLGYAQSTHSFGKCLHVIFCVDWSKCKKLSSVKGKVANLTVCSQLSVERVVENYPVLKVKLQI